MMKKAILSAKKGVRLMKKAEKYGVRMREQDAGVRVADDGVHADGEPVDTQDTGADTGRGSGIASLPSHPRNRQDGSRGTNAGGSGKGYTTAAEAAAASLVDLCPITNPVILRQKEIVEMAKSRLDNEMSILKGMLMIDRPSEDASADIDRMMYRVPADTI